MRYVVAALVLLAGSAEARLMTFNSTSYLTDYLYTEKGIVAEGDRYGFVGPLCPRPQCAGTAFLADNETNWSPFLRFTLLNGNSFSLDYFDVIPYGTNRSCGIEGPGANLDTCPRDIEFPYIHAEGFRNGNIVASYSLYLPEGPLTRLILPGFTNLDSLVISAIANPPSGYDCTDWCSEFALDNISLTDVPEPSSLLLMSLGVFALFGARRLGGRSEGRPR